MASANGWPPEAPASIKALAASLYPSQPLAVRFLVITGYFDESGTHMGSPHHVLAGFVGGTEEWIALEREWRKILRNHNITHVRAKQLFHRQGQHKGWSHKQVKQLWYDLLYVLQERELYASKTVLYEDYYKQFYVGSGPQKKERLDTRYALCFRSIVHALPLLHQHRHPQGAVNLVLESGHKNAPDAVRVFNEMKTDGAPYSAGIGSVSFMAKKESCALQAADMLAYWSFKTECQHSEERGEWLSDFEQELLECRIAIVEHLMKPSDLQDWRAKLTHRNRKAAAPSFRLDDDYEQASIDDPFLHLGRRFY